MTSSPPKPWETNNPNTTSTTSSNPPELPTRPPSLTQTVQPTSLYPSSMYSQSYNTPYSSYSSSPYGMNYG